MSVALRNTPLLRLLPACFRVFDVADDCFPDSVAANRILAVCCWCGLARWESAKGKRKTVVLRCECCTTGRLSWGTAQGPQVNREAHRTANDLPTCLLSEHSRVRLWGAWRFRARNPWQVASAHLVTSTSVRLPSRSNLSRPRMSTKAICSRL